MARDRFKSSPHSSFRLCRKGNRTTDGRQYNIPTTSEVAGLIVGDFTKLNCHRDIIVEHQTTGLQRITYLHPSFMSITYPLIYPYAEDGYRTNIPLRNLSNNESKRQKLTMKQYYCFRLQQRLHEGKSLLLGGRLLQQYIVDSYMAIEEERFRWIINNQTKLRADLYSGLMDVVHRGDSDWSTVGKSIILPSSHTGGPHYKAQNYQDAMTICKWVGYPDLFLTFTCNPKWPEIKDMLQKISQKDHENRADIVCRVFEIKLVQLMQDLKTEQPFGQIIICLYTIEFQKRGLLHAHILLFLHQTTKNPSGDHIDNIITAEIPDPHVDLDAYNAVKNFMMHGPCGSSKPKCPCMVQGRCSKLYPKKFVDKTIIDAEGFPIYRRRKTNITICKKDIFLDNRSVVPYNRNLLVKFDAHINVELYNFSRAIKYLFKYLHKGSVRAIATIESSDKGEGNDEIKIYLDCRYISAAEACWMIFQFDIHYRHPSVERLPFHFLDNHTVVFRENNCVENVLSMPGMEKTKFTELFEANKKYVEARQLSYSDFPIQ
ncbi:uncharacterized protein LOC112504042 [Cynara cardunculus var. scolymus]|uniref:uncharacterized protein LOC112504042 n=1 Tax=Cynara cardunculus var. scolymus TaxID=59895 RepID=UPI000D625AD7|nr:uncharacterized protein LOC112504042 [Cynara cardunculus var. scolymus]